MPLPKITARRLAALVAAAVAVYVFSSSVWMAVLAYTPLPFFDSWCCFDPNRYSLQSLFAQHNEHRLVVPGLFFYADLVLDHGTNKLLVVLNYLCVAATAALLFLHAPRRGPRSDALLVGALVIALLYSGMQYTNLVWGFQLQFFIVQLLAAAAIAAASLTARPRLAAAATAFTIVLAVLATFSLASGMLVWPIVVLVAVRARARPLVPRLVALAGAVTIALYFAGFSFASMRYATWDPLKMLAFWLAYLGGPAGTVISGALSRVLHVYSRAEIVSAVAGVVVLVLTVRLIGAGMRRGAARPDLVLAAIAAYVVLTAAVTAHGRALMPLVEAISSRYTTPPLLLYAVLAVAALRNVWTAAGGPVPLSRRFVAGALVLVALLAIHQPDKLNWATIDHQRFLRARLAIELGIYDPDAWKIVYPTPETIVPLAARLRAERLSVFAEDARWIDAVGAPVAALAPAQTVACAGNMDSLAPLDAPAKGGDIATGWSSAVDGGAPERIALASDDGVIVGYGAPGDPRPDVSAARPDLTSPSGWLGYAQPKRQARELQAWSIRGGERCALSTPRTLLTSRPH